MDAYKDLSATVSILEKQVAVKDLQTSRLDLCKEMINNQDLPLTELQRADLQGRLSKLRSKANVLKTALKDC